MSRKPEQDIHEIAISQLMERLRNGTATYIDIAAAGGLRYHCSMCASKYGYWLEMLAGADGETGISAAAEYLENWQKQQRNLEASDDHDIPDEDQLD